MLALCHFHENFICIVETVGFDMVQIQRFENVYLGYIGMSYILHIYTSLCLTFNFDLHIGRHLMLQTTISYIDVAGKKRDVNIARGGHMNYIYMLYCAGVMNNIMKCIIT